MPLVPGPASIRPPASLATGSEGAYATANGERLRQAASVMTRSALWGAAIVFVFSLYVDPTRAYLTGASVLGFLCACVLLRNGYPETGKLVSFSTATLTIVALVGTYGIESQAHLLVAPLVLPAYTVFSLRWQRTLALAVCALVLAAAYSGQLESPFAGAPTRPEHLELVFVAVVMLICYWMIDDLLCVDRDFRERSGACVAEIESRHALLDADAERLRAQSADLVRANDALGRELLHGQGIQRQLRASNEQLEQFVYAASHDLKEPLRSITSFLQLIRRKLQGQDDPELQEYFAFVLASATRMTNLLDGLLTYSRADKTEQAAEWVDLDRLLIVLRSELREVLVSSRGTIAIVGPELGCVFATKRPLHGLLRELVDNALKFAAPGHPPVVTISVTHAEDGVATIAIRDRGIGIAPEFRDQVFHLFQRLQLVDDYEGAGIGLALVRKLALATRAQVSLVDNADGVGICAEVCLPAAPSYLPPAERLPNARAGASPSATQIRLQPARDEVFTTL